MTESIQYIEHYSDGKYCFYVPPINKLTKAKHLINEAIKKCNNQTRGSGSQLGFQDRVSKEPIYVSTKEKIIFFTFKLN